MQSPRRAARLPPGELPPEVAAGIIEFARFQAKELSPPLSPPRRVSFARGNLRRICAFNRADFCVKTVPRADVNEAGLGLNDGRARKNRLAIIIRAPRARR